MTRHTIFSQEPENAYNCVQPNFELQLLKTGTGQRMPALKGHLDFLPHLLATSWKLKHELELGPDRFSRSLVP